MTKHFCDACGKQLDNGERRTRAMTLPGNQLQREPRPERVAVDNNARPNRVMHEGDMPRQNQIQLELCEPCANSLDMGFDQLKAQFSQKRNG